MKRLDKKENLNSSFFSAAIVHWVGGGGYSPMMMTNMGRLRPKGVLFVRLQLTERLVISLVEVHERVGKSVISRVVTWYMGSGLKAQNMTGIRAQRKGLRAQKNGIRDHKAFKPESGIRFITRSKLISYHNIFPHNKVSVHRISWPRYITYSCFRLAAVPVIRSPGCLTKIWCHILN